MIKKDKKTLKGNVVKTHIRVIEGYIDNGKVKQKTIKSFGYLEDQSDQISFMNYVKEFNDNYLKSKNEKKEKLKSSFNRVFYDSRCDTLYNYGYKFLEAIYNSLKLDEFFKMINSKTEYSLSEIFKFLVIERILNPDSKRATFQIKESLYKFDGLFELHDVYRALEKFDECKVELQKYLNDQVKELVGRDTSFAYYDVTNYYTTIDFPNDKDDIRQRGVSKEHRLDPIIQLGLFLDDKGLPISMSLFKGNTSDSLTLQPVMKSIKANYNLNKLIVVADKGINSSYNIDYIINNGDGYVFSQILKGKKGSRYQGMLFDEQGWYSNENNTFKHKEFQEEYIGHDKDNNKVKRLRKVLIYWSKDEALMTKRKRDDKIGKAMKSLKNNAFSIKHSYEEYIRQTPLISETGEVANEIIKEIDYAKIENDSLYDGYFCIITSELNFDYKKILDIYQGLWRIEESFKITKSDLEARPIYLSKENRINGHFLICFVALLIVRLLQLKLNYSISVERIVRALNTSKCLEENNETIHVLINDGYKDLKTQKNETLNDYLSIIEVFNVSTPYERYKKKDFDKFLSTIENK